MFLFSHLVHSSLLSFYLCSLLTHIRMPALFCKAFNIFPCLQIFSHTFSYFYYSMAPFHTLPYFTVIILQQKSNQLSDIFAKNFQKFPALNFNYHDYIICTEKKQNLSTSDVPNSSGSSMLWWKTPGLFQKISPYY